MVIRNSIKTSPDFSPRDRKAKSKHRAVAMIKPQNLATLEAELKSVLNSILNSILNSSQNGICVLNSDFTVRRVNLAFAQLVNAKADELKGKKCYDIHPGPLCHKPQCCLRRIASGETNTQCETEFAGSDGTRTFQVSAAPFHNSGGEFLGIIETFEDITESKQIHQQIIESEEKYRHFFQNAPIALWENDFSECKEYFDELRSKGVTDFKSYFRGNDDAIIKCRGLIRSSNRNQAVLDLFEAKNNQELNEYVGRALPTSKELLQGYADVFAALAEGKTSFINEETKVTVKNNRREVLLRYSVPPGSRDTLSRVFISAFDITERKQAEERLSESENNYRALIELGDEVGESIAMLVDQDGKEGMYVFVSDQLSRLTGYSKEELLGRSAFDLVGPRYREAALNRHRRRLAGETIPELVEISMIRKDGLEIPIELTASISTFKGKRSTVVYMRDITRRKQLETELAGEREKYRSLFDLAPVAIWEIDCSKAKEYFDKLRTQGVTDFKKYFSSNKDGLFKCVGLLNTTSVNKAVLTLYEAKNFKEQREFIQAALLTNLETQIAYIDLLAALAEGKTDFVKEETKVTVKNNLREVLLQYSIAPSCEENLSRVLVSAFDITARKQVEEQAKAYQWHLEDQVNQRTSQIKKEIERRKLAQSKLKEQYKAEGKLRHELEAQIEQRNEFTRALVHELKTPLIPLVGASELLSRKLKDEPWLRLAKQLNRGANEISERIDELFDLTKNEIGTLKLKYSLVQPDELLREMADYVEPQTLETGHQLIVDTSKPMPQICCDEKRLRQVLLNLLENTFKFTPAGTVTILKARLKGPSIVFQVKDSGPGIPKSDLKRLFVPYSHMDNNRENFGGLGLGLSLCKVFVELHGGRIWARSTPGKGTCISFTVPLTQQSDI